MKVKNLSEQLQPFNLVVYDIPSNFKFSKKKRIKKKQLKKLKTTTYYQSKITSIKTL